MRHALLLLTIPTIAAAVVAAACSTSLSEPPAEEADGGDTVLPPGTDPATTPSTTDPTGPAGSGLATGLPCDVQGVIENRCIACHQGESPPPLLDYADLSAPSTKDPTKSRAAVAVELMKAGLMPPQPAVPAEDDEIAAFENWVNGGLAKNPESCTPIPADAGAPPLPDDAGADAGDAGVVTCTSGQTWMGQPSPLMHPGRACLNCHQQQGGPNLRIAGTVYPTLHEPDDCIGSAPPPRLTVIVTDSRPVRPRTVRMQVNVSGNFFTRERLTPPFRVTVTDGRNTRSMNQAVTSGDCNSCHTQDGANGAPGRIMAPGP